MALRAHTLAHTLSIVSIHSVLSYEIPEERGKSRLMLERRVLLIRLDVNPEHRTISRVTTYNMVISKSAGAHTCSNKDRKRKFLCCPTQYQGFLSPFHLHCSYLFSNLPQFTSLIGFYGRSNSFPATGIISLDERAERDYKQGFWSKFQGPVQDRRFKLGIWEFSGRGTR